MRVNESEREREKYTYTNDIHIIYYCDYYYYDYHYYYYILYINKSYIEYILALVDNIYYI